MGRPVFDHDDGDWIYPTSGDRGIDSDGHYHRRIGSHYALDTDTGELHYTSGWNDDRGSDDLFRRTDRWNDDRDSDDF